MHRRIGTAFAAFRELSWFALTAVVLGVLILPSLARAQSGYPSRPITFVVPNSPGTVLDIFARLYADRVGKLLNGSVNVVNRPGAGGLLAAQAVASAPADGYTFLVANSGHSNLGVIHKDLQFDPTNDFVGIAMFGEAPVVVTAAPGMGVKSLAEFVELAKRKPGTINYVSLGIGSSTHIAAAYFERQANIRLVHVPYKDMNLSASDQASNIVQVSFAPIAPNIGAIKNGTFLALAVSSREPMQTPFFVPTAISQGVDYVYLTWYGLLAMKGTPTDIVQKLSGAISEASKDQEMIAKVEAQAVTARFLAAAQFQQRIRDDVAQLAPVLKDIAALPKGDR